jgi:D-alanine-D-alanine ligase
MIMDLYGRFNEVDLSNFTIVYIAESITSRKVSLIDTHQDQELKTDTNHMLRILRGISNKVVYYDHPRKFCEDISFYKGNCVVFGNWFGKDSPNRKGWIPAICEVNSIPYIGADTHTHIVCMDKYLSTLYCRDLGLKAPKTVLCTQNTRIDNLVSMTLPLVVKPNFDGNSIGISNKSIYYNYLDALQNATFLRKRLKREIIIQEYIEGHEIEVFIFGNENETFIIDERKIVVNGEDYFEDLLFGYESKINLNNYDEIESNMLSSNQLDKLKFLFKTLTKTDYIRIDGRLKGSDFYIIELSADCSVNEKSNVGKAFRRHGYTFADGIRFMIANALL